MTLLGINYVYKMKGKTSKMYGLHIFTFYLFYLLSYTQNIYFSTWFLLVDIYEAFVKGMRYHGLVSCKIFIHCSYELIRLTDGLRNKLKLVATTLYS